VLSKNDMGRCNLQIRRILRAWENVQFNNDRAGTGKRFDTHDLVWDSDFSETALFTYMVKSEQIHLHFVDGNNGGYTAASRDREARETARRLAQKN